MSQVIQIIAARAQHLERIKALGAAYYEPQHHALSSAFQRWLCLDNPAGAAQLVIAEEDGEWIGIIVLVPVQLKVDGAYQPACFAVNVLTHPAHRGKNLFVMMIRAAREFLSAENRWLLGHPNRNALPGWQRQKMQFRPALRPFIVKPCSPFSSLRMVPVRSRQALDDLPCQFWSSLSAPGDVQIDRSAAFMDWRFLRPPHKTYDLRLVYRRAQPVAMLVTAAYRNPVRLLIDHSSNDGSFDAVRAPLHQPTLVMLPDSPANRTGCLFALQGLGFDKRMSFFASTWTDMSSLDWSSVTLAASDF